MDSSQTLLRVRVGPALAWCSGRASGNLGDHVGDDPDAVARNRAELARAAGLPDPKTWVWMRQVHGAHVYTATGPTTPSAPPEADAAVTTTHGLALAVVTADCAPLVLANDDSVGVVHAGHRGLAAGIIEATVAQLRATGAGSVRAFLGPCIRAPRYEFSAHDLERFVAQFGTSVATTTRTGRPALDLPAAIRVVLDREGVDDFDDCGVCTADDAESFSYRRDGATGRQATIAVLP